MKKEKIYLILTTVFTILTFIIVAYILAKEGKINAGYSLIPCLFTILFSQLCIKEKNKNKKLPEKYLNKHKKITKIIIIIIILFIILNLISIIILKDTSNKTFIEIKPNLKQEITNNIIVDGIEDSYTIYYYHCCFSYCKNHPFKNYLLNLSSIALFFSSTFSDALLRAASIFAASSESETESI